MCICRRFLSSKCTDAITERTPVSFLWRLRGAGLEETEEVTNTMDHVSQRGVAMPEGWVAAFHNLDLPARAIDAAKTAEKMVDPDGIGISEVHCECGFTFPYSSSHG